MTMTFIAPQQKPNRSPARRLRFGEEEQRNERTLTFHAKHKSRSKRCEACSDVSSSSRLRRPVRRLCACAYLRFPRAPMGARRVPLSPGAAFPYFPYFSYFLPCFRSFVQVSPTGVEHSPHLSGAVGLLLICHPRLAPGKPSSSAPKSALILLAQMCKAVFTERIFDRTRHCAQ